MALDHAPLQVELERSQSAPLARRRSGVALSDRAKRVLSIGILYLHSSLTFKKQSAIEKLVQAALRLHGVPEKDTNDNDTAYDELHDMTLQAALFAMRNHTHIDAPTAMRIVDDLIRIFI